MDSNEHENSEQTIVVQAKQPLSKEEQSVKTKKILLIVFSVAVALLVIFGFIFGNIYSIKKNQISSFDSRDTSKPAVLFMTSTSCQFCKKVVPQISEIKDKYKDKITFYYINVQDNGEGEKLYRKYPPNPSSGKLGVPTVHYFYAGTESRVARTVTGYGGSGNNNMKEQIQRYVDELLENPTGKVADKEEDQTTVKSDPIKQNQISSFAARDLTKPAVLFFGKEGCPYCEKVIPGVSQLKATYKNDITFYYANMNDDGEGRAIAGDYITDGLGARRGAPTICYFYVAQDFPFAIRTGEISNSKWAVKEYIDTIMANPTGSMA